MYGSKTFLFSRGQPKVPNNYPFFADFQVHLYVDYFHDANGSLNPSGKEDSFKIV